MVDLHFHVHAVLSYKFYPLESTMGIPFQLFANRRFYAIMVAAVTLGRFIAVHGFYNTSKCSLSRQISVDALRPVYTGDFCRATQCKFCRAEATTSISHV